MSVRLPVPIHESPTPGLPPHRATGDAVVPAPGPDQRAESRFSLTPETAPTQRRVAPDALRPTPQEARPRPIGPDGSERGAARPEDAAATAALPSPTGGRPTLLLTGPPLAEGAETTARSAGNVEGYKAYRQALQERPAPRILDVKI